MVEDEAEEEDEALSTETLRLREDCCASVFVFFNGGLLVAFRFEQDSSLLFAIVVDTLQSVLVRLRLRFRIKKPLSLSLSSFLCRSQYFIQSVVGPFHK